MIANSLDSGRQDGLSLSAVVGSVSMQLSV
jgi:hypothetical protein